MSELNVVKFHRPTPQVQSGLDWVFAYPRPTHDSPFALTPLSIMFPAKMQEDLGKSVRLWDQRWDDMDMLDDYIKEAKNIGVSAFTGYQCAEAADILERAKRLNPKIVTHLGGHHARLCTDDVMRESFIDQVWPERAYHEHSFPFSPEAQRLWRRGDWQYVTSTGCPYACTFCALRSAWSPRPLAQIEIEIDAIHELTGFTEISMCDPNIGYEKFKDSGGATQRISRVERMLGLGKILRKHGILWDGNIRADYVNKELVDAMAWSGCFSIEFGCESGNDDFLKKVIKKGHGIDAIKNANRCMAGSGISVMNSWVRGMPTETHAQWLDTMNLIDWIMDVAPEARASVYRFTPYPGGPAYDMAVKGEGIAKFTPPTTMRGWGELKLMVDATYWAAGLCFRLDNTQKNFPGEDWALIEPYVELARKLWRERRPEDFDKAEEVEKLISWQVRKHNAAAVA